MGKLNFWDKTSSETLDFSTVTVEHFKQYKFIVYLLRVLLQYIHKVL